MRLPVQEMVSECRRCYLGELHGGPLPMEGRVGATFMVLGPAPGQGEDSTRWIWTGRYGKWLRQLMVDCGIPQSDVSWGHVVSCRVPSRSKTRDGTPTDVHVASCSTIRQMQVEVLDPKVVLLTGATAMRAYRPDWVFKDMVGWPFFLTGRLYVTTHHPIEGYGSDEVAEKMKQVIKWARMRGRLDDQGRLNMDDWPEVCSMVGCERDVERYDEMGVPYCLEHHGMRGREKVGGVQMEMV